MTKKTKSKGKQFISEFDSTDIVAMIMIIGGFVLLGMHVDDLVISGLITLVAGFYFGRKSGGDKHE